MDYTEFKAEILKRYGFDLYQYKENCSEYIRQNFPEGVDSWDDYLEYLCVYGEYSLSRFKLNITMKGSQYFREGSWRLIDRMIPDLYETFGEVRCWCAGCNKGEEVFSLLSLIESHKIPKDKYSILASDINPDLLDCVKIEYVSPYLMRKFPVARFLFENDGKSIKPDLELMGQIQTKCFDLLSDEYPLEKYHIVLCRNIIKFFEETVTIPRVKQNLLGSVVPGGILFVGWDWHEFMTEEDFDIISVEKDLYQKKWLDKND